DLIQSTTQELSLALSGNIPQAEERMLRYRSQLDQVHPIMRESKKTHKEAIESMKHLLNRFEEERKVMVTVATYRQRCYCELESYLQKGKGTPDIDDRVVGRSSNSLA